MAAIDDRVQAGTFCSTSGTYFNDKDALAAHYKSDFHRYNLKRKLAGLPPVTKEWFDARREQLAAGQTAAGATLPTGATRIWVDPLTRKKFKTESTYLAHTRSKKFIEAMRKEGLTAPPEPTVLVLQQRDDVPASTAAPSESGASVSASVNPPKATAGYKVVPPSGGLPRKQDGDEAMDEEADDVNGSDWETASEDSEMDVVQAAEDGNDVAQDDGEPLAEWDLQRSLFDNHVSRSFEANLEYMFKHYGFYFPDAEYLKDPEGLLRYLGAKLQHGRVPLYTAGDDASAKQFRSVHAVQRHMVDSQRCKMLYEGNEEEYEDFYHYDDDEGEAGAQAAEGEDEGKQVATSDAGSSAVAHVAGYELVVGDAAAGEKVLGSRDLARYYRQRIRPTDERLSVVINTMLAKYRNLGIATKDSSDPGEKRARVHAGRRYERNKLRVFMNHNVIRNLPKNVPY